jgi:HD-like signal output (HDOD) protein
LRRRISNVVEAVSYLGLALTKSIVVSFAATASLPVRAPSFDADAFQQHAMAVAQMARFVTAPNNQPDESFAAGLLHDVGKLLLASAMPARFEMISRAAALSGRSFEDEELIAGGCAPHRRLGVYLLNLWGLPWPVVQAIANYPVAPTVEQKRLGAAGAVYLARQLLREAAGEESSVVDVRFIEGLGLEGKVEAWRACAKELVDGGCGRIVVGATVDG